jgi:hypothetical protein
MGKNLTAGSKDVDVAFTSSDGCLIKVTGTVDYTIIPPQITKFTGTISISGGEGCPNGTLNFRSDSAETRSSKARLNARFDTTDIFKVSRIRWEGDTELTKALNKQQFNKVMCYLMRSLPVADFRVTSKASHRIRPEAVVVTSPAERSV